MTRKDFLQKMGLGAAFVLSVPCLHSCGGDDDDEPGAGGGATPPNAGDKDFTIDLDDALVVADFDGRGYTIAEGTVVAPLDGGGYAAASLVCSHQNNRNVTYDAATDEWFCTVHGARFARDSGAPRNDVTDNDLRIYQTEVTGNTLRVFG